MPRKKTKALEKTLRCGEPGCTYEEEVPVKLPRGWILMPDETIRCPRHKPRECRPKPPVRNFNQ